MTGRPRIRTPEYWADYRYRKNQEKRIARWRLHFARLKLERDCANCEHHTRWIEYASQKLLDPDFGICESCSYMIR